jgi:DNA-binding CsgD family transcriptional regulator/tetratricopeptide (TPR) repeat protein
VLGQLDQALADAAAGAGCVALIYGEAGIGKTRLCQQVQDEHRRQGGQVLLGRCSPEESAIAYGAIADTLRFARRAEPRVWESARTRAGVLRTITPEIGDAHQSGGGSDRLLLFEALLDVVEEAAHGDRAVLWVLDDMHWADDATWHFVQYAARRVADMSLVVAVTYRDEEIGPASPRWSSLVTLKRDPHVLTVALRRLGTPDAGRLARAAAPNLAEEMVAEVVERSAGTPLLIEELAKLAAQPGEFPALPDIVRVTVRERADRLPSAARDLLEVAAVAGLSVDARLLRTLRPEAAPDELVAAGLVEPDRAGFRFRHPLLQESAYQDVPPPRRTALHQEVARGLSRGYQDGGSVPAAERIAFHLDRAGQPEAALAVLEEGAGRAQQAGEIGRAATLSLATLGLARRHDQLAPRRAGLEQRAIWALYAARRWSELDPLIRDAWSRSGTLRPAERIPLANVFSEHLFWTGAVSEAWRLLEAELAELEPTQASGDAAMLATRGGIIALFRGDHEQARQHAERGLAVARGAGDAAAEWFARYNLARIGYAISGNRQATSAAFSELADSSAALGNRLFEARTLLAVALYNGGALPHVEAGIRAAEQAGSPITLAELHVLRGSILLLRGHADEAESSFVRFGPELRFGEPLSAPPVNTSEALLHLHRGDLDAASRLLSGPAAATEAAQLAGFAIDRSAALGWLAWEQDRWADAAAYLERSARLWRGWPLHALVGGPVFVPLHVDALLRLGKPADAATLLQRVPGGGQLSPFYDAALATARFRAEPTADRADDAAAATAAAPWPWLAGLTGRWRGELLGDLAAATAAAGLFADIGADRQAQRTGEILRGLGGRTPQQRGSAGSLSVREMEVARLVAEGLSNPAIAGRLYLSRPTVASHVAHILTKLGFASRAQIAAWVAGQGRADSGRLAGAVDRLVVHDGRRAAGQETGMICGERRLVAVLARERPHRGQ